MMKHWFLSQQPLSSKIWLKRNLEKIYKNCSQISGSTNLKARLIKSSTDLCRPSIQMKRTLSIFRSSKTNTIQRGWTKKNFLKFVIIWLKISPHKLFEPKNLISSSYRKVSVRGAKLDVQRRFERIHDPSFLWEERQFSRFKSELTLLMRWKKMNKKFLKMIDFWSTKSPCWHSLSMNYDY